MLAGSNVPPARIPQPDAYSPSAWKADRSASAPIERAPSSAPESANNNSAKKNCRRRPAAAAPPSRPEQVKQVGLLAERAGIGAASRARVTTARLVNAAKFC